MSESIGAKLRLAREERRLTLEQASEATRVRMHYLQALEGDDVSRMPSAAQARGFLRIYADFLGIPLDQLVPQPPLTPTPAYASPVPEEGSRPATAQPKVSARALFAQIKGRLGRRAAEEPPESAEGGAGAPTRASTDVHPEAAGPDARPAAPAPAAEPTTPKKKASA